MSRWAFERGLSVDEVVTEGGSGLGAKRPRLARLLADGGVTPIVVEHRAGSRASGSSTSPPRSAQERPILVVDEAELDDDLVRDLTEALTSFCARLYGPRGARNRALRAITRAKNATVE